MEVEGVEGHINVHSAAEEFSHESKIRDGRRGGLAKGTKSNRPRSTQPLVHDPGGTRSASSNSTNDGDEVLDYLPTSVDLAKSFLQSEPDKEKAEIQANLTKSRNLHQSVRSDDEEEGFDTGVGVGFLLPGFLADFLQGVGNRLEVKIKEIQIDIDFKLDISCSTPSSNPISAHFELITFRLSVQEVQVNGVTSNNTDDDRSNPRSPSSEGPEDKPHSIQHRRISVKNVQGMVVSDASLFSTFSQLSGPPSPVISSTFKKKAPQRFTDQPFHKSASSSSSNNLEMSQSTIFRRPTHNVKTASKLESSIVTTTVDEERFTDRRIDDQNEYADYSNQNSTGEEGSSDSQYMDSEDEADVPPAIFDTFEREGNIKDSDTLPAVPYHSHPNRRRGPVTTQLERDSIPPLENLLLHQTPTGDLLSSSVSLDVLTSPSPGGRKLSPIRHKVSIENREDLFNEPTSSFQNNTDFQESSLSNIPHSETVNSSFSSHQEDLAQSKIFSHEEAESMYMSAMSDLPVPGAWDSTDSGEEEHSQDVPAILGRSDSQSSRAAVFDPDLLVESDLKTSRSFTQSAKQQDRSGSSQSNYAQPLPPQKDAESPTIIEGQSFSPQTKATSQESTDASPRSERSSRVVKRFIVIDFIDLRIPSHPHALNSEGQNVNSCYQPRGKKNDGLEIPGAFSTSSIHRSSATLACIGLENDFLHQSNAKSSSLADDVDGKCLPTSISIGDISLLSDIGLVRLMIAVVQQQLPAFSTSNETPKEPLAGDKGSSKFLMVDANRFSWLFVDVLRGQIETTDQAIEPIQLLDADVLLSMTLSGLHISSKTEGLASITDISVRVFTFGYAADNILSFDSGIKMRESTMDILLPVDHDIAIKIVQSTGALQVNISTLPLHVIFDLARLDETFGWFGGLSSVLGLGSSMMSTVTMVEQKYKTPRKSNRPRGVRFETPDVKDDALHPRKFKVTTRIGGLLLDLQGKNSSVQLESTAMKFVSRTEGIGLQIDKCKFSGPHPHQTIIKAAISIHLDNIRIEYLPNPKEVDLARLLALLSPSRDKYEPDDDVLLDTLLRQRRQGGVIRATIAMVNGNIPNLEDLDQFAVLGQELTKLSTVAKYLPEDDRPGILTLALVRDLEIGFNINDNFKAAQVTCRNLEVAHVAFPSLILLGIRSLRVQRQPGEELLGEAIPPSNDGVEGPSPMVMARLIGDELEPTVKVKLWNLRAEYHVTTVMAILGLVESPSGEILFAEMVNSVATLTGRQLPPRMVSHASSNSDKSSSGSKTLRYDVAIRESVIGLNPRNSPSRGLLVLSITNVAGVVPNSDEAEVSAILEIKKASLMVVDNTGNIVNTKPTSVHSKPSIPNAQVQSLTDMGYVSISDVSSAKVTLNVNSPGKDGERAIDVEVRDDLFVIESCADSTQTLLGILNGLNPPMPPNRELKYRTEIVPVQDMLASFSGDAFVTNEITGLDEDEYAIESDEADMVDDEVPQNLEIVSSFYNPDPSSSAEALANSILEDDLQSLAVLPAIREIGDKRLLESFQEQYEVAPGSEPLDFQEDHFGAGSAVGGTAHRWNSDRNTYDFTSEVKIRGSPFRIRVRDVHIIWNLFDGFDWQHTRDAISQAVADVESKAIERIARRSRRKPVESEDEEDSVIGDFLFNSIYIGIPANRDPRDLTRQVNRNIDDLASETGSYATSVTATSSPSRQTTTPRPKRKKLRLARSKHHKMTFELKGVSMDLVAFPPGSGETQSSIDIRVQDLDIFDHVPTSTWKKFATYMHDAGERESGTSMVHVEILNVKPVPDLAASEIILKVSISRV